MLNPHLDAAALAATFAARRRVQVRDILLPEAADAIHDCLARQVPWSFSYRGEGEDVLLEPESIAAMGADERVRIGQSIVERAARGEFSFGFMSYPMVRHYRAGEHRELVLSRVVEALASPEFIGFARRVTGDDAIARVDAQATRYNPGHFLNLHDDAGYPGRERRCAYVLNFSRGWRAEWGGLLQFLGGAGDVVDSFVPHFNSLSLFAVPAPHIVSYVAPYAGGPRLAITGWFTV